jgi:hypothetical protein
MVLNPAASILGPALILFPRPSRPTASGDIQRDHDHPEPGTNFLSIIYLNGAGCAARPIQLNQPAFSYLQAVAIPLSFVVTTEKSRGQSRKQDISI